LNPIQNKIARFQDLGTIAYSDAWDYQTSLFENTLAIKTSNRTLAPESQQQTDNYLLFCEHPHVYTLGKSGKESNLLLKDDALSAIQATYHHINRGGDITYHGPGQVVGYPIFDLDNFFTDIHKYLRSLEEIIIRTVDAYGVRAGRIAGLTGVWVDHENESAARKICAFGVRASRWVTMHGFALNVNTDLNYFNHIIPCGIPDKAVTSLQRETGQIIPMHDVSAILRRNFEDVFGLQLEVQPTPKNLGIH
jgi:lipoyl(octanoyl) transferase